MTDIVVLMTRNVAKETVAIQAMSVVQIQDLIAVLLVKPVVKAPAVNRTKRAVTEPVVNRPLFHQYQDRIV